MVLVETSGGDTCVEPKRQTVEGASEGTRAVDENMGLCDWGLLSVNGGWRATRSIAMRNGESKTVEVDSR
jgi:hypothetical protein